METRKITAILAALVLLSAAVAQEAEQEQKEKVSNTLTASCLVKVTCDPAILPLSLETIDYLMHSSGVAGRAAVEVLGPRDEPYEFDEWLSIEPLSVMPATPEVGDRPKPAATTPTTRSRPTRSRPDDEAVLDERDLEELRYFEQAAKYKRKRSSEDEEKEKPRPSASRTRYVTSRRTAASGKTGRGPEPPSDAAAPPAVPEQTLLFRLEVLFPDGAKPAAEEFMNALIKNLERTLMRAYGEHRDELENEYPDAQQQCELARQRLSEALGLTDDTDADRQTAEQLQQTADFSGWRPQMALADAINELKQSVDPPLKIVVLWGDLLGNAEIDQTTPINMDGLREAPVSKALDLLLKSVTSGTAELGYEIDRGVITIATVDSLPSAKRRLSQMAQMDTPVEMLLDRKNDLFRHKQELEMEIARAEARRSATEEQIHRINAAVEEKVKSDPVAFEIQRLIDINARELERAREALDSGKRVTGVDEVTEKLARAKIDLAKRREELSRSAGGSEVAGLTADLTQLMINLAVSRAEFEVVNRQLAETEEQLKKASAVDPEISQIRLAQEELEMAEHWVSQLRFRLEGLRKPTVTVLGGT